MVKYIRIKRTALYYKGKRAKYEGETIYPNGRHSVTAVVMTGGNNDRHGGIPIELDVADVDFLFSENNREITKITSA